MPPPDSVDTIWHTRTSIPTPLGLASQLGWLREEFARDAISVRMVDAALREKLPVDAAWMAMPNLIHQGGNAPSIWARAQGIDTKVIGLSWIDESQCLLSLGDSGVRRPRDLRGCRIGIPMSNTSASLAIDHWRASALRGALVALELAGLTYKDVEFIDLRVPEMEPTSHLHLVDAKAGRQRHVFEGTYQRELFALIRREVDAIYVKGPLGAQLAHDLHLHVVADIRDHPDPLARINCSTPRPITVGTEFLRNYPDLVVRFLSRILAIGAWARLHPNEIAHYIARQSGSTEHWVREAYGSNLYKCLCTNLDALSIAGMDAYKSFLLQWGFLKQDFDMADWIDPVPLSRASSVLQESVA